MLIYWAYDIISDQMHKLTIIGKTYVYKYETPYFYHNANNPIITVINRHDKVRVMRIIYEKDCMAIKVKLENHIQGWVFPPDSMIIN